MLRAIRRVQTRRQRCGVHRRHPLVDIVNGNDIMLARTLKTDRPYCATKKFAEEIRIYHREEGGGRTREQKRGREGRRGRERERESVLPPMNTSTGERIHSTIPNDTRRVHARANSRRTIGTVALQRNVQSSLPLSSLPLLLPGRYFLEISPVLASECVVVTIHRP